MLCIPLGGCSFMGAVTGGGAHCHRLYQSCFLGITAAPAHSDLGTRGGLGDTVARRLHSIWSISAVAISFLLGCGGRLILYIWAYLFVPSIPQCMPATALCSCAPACDMREYIETSTLSTFASFHRVIYAAVSRPCWCLLFFANLLGVVSTRACWRYA